MADLLLPPSAWPSSARVEPNKLTASLFFMCVSLAHCTFKASTFNYKFSKIDLMNTLATRIKSERKIQCLSQEALGKLVGVSKSAVNQWESGLTKQLVGENLLRTAKALKINPDWLSTGRGSKELISSEKNISKIVLGGFDVWDDDTPLNDDEVALPFYREVELSAGSGRHQVVENHGRKLRFAKSTLRKSNVTIAKAACVTVSGNSMEPVLPNGCVVGIDTDNKYIVDGKPYAINYHGDLLVKRLYKIPGGGFRLNSFNSEYLDINCSADDSEVIIIGKVFWSSQLW